MNFAEQKVLDSSVVLAILRNERAGEDLLDLIDGAVLSTVTLSEVLTKATEWGIADSPLLVELLESLDRVEPFTATQAKLAADIWLETKRSGLSLGDRACLALAIELGADVYTADRVWAGVKVGCEIHLIR